MSMQLGKKRDSQDELQPSRSAGTKKLSSAAMTCREELIPSGPLKVFPSGALFYFLRFDVLLSLDC